MPVLGVLQRMERTGVLIDPFLLSQHSEELGRRLHALEGEAHTLAGQPFNLGSPKQLGEILFGKLGLPVVKKTATGQPSTDEEVLEKLAEDYPLPKLLLEHRSLSKLKSTYADKLPRMVDPKTGRVHTSFSQATAVTGRLSSSEPNLQNIPIRTPEGRRIRAAFIAPREHLIVSADYSQIELRIMAHLSDDARLLEAFANGEDVHRATAGEVFGVAPAEVSSEQRRYAKVINFGLIYGMSAHGLAKNLGIERAAAQSWIDRYFARYPGVAEYMDRTRAEARDKGLCGDRLRPPPLPARHPRQPGRPSRRCRACGDQRADAGHGRGPDQARDDRHRRLAGLVGPEVEAGAAGPRRAGAGSAQGRTRHHPQRAAQADGRCRRAEGAAAGGGRRRRQLGRGALMAWRAVSLPPFIP